MIDINNITFGYGRRRKPVLSDFSLSIDAGGIYGLLGKNGAGKSTLLYLIAGLLSPQKGNIKVSGADPRLRRPSTLADIFIVPEEFSLPPLRMEEFVRINKPFYPNFSAEDLKRHLTTFEMDPEMHLGSLSMGQKKKAYMCFALACNTPLLLLDEPTNGLDIPGKSRFRQFIVSAMSDDRTVLISTHQVRDIDRILDHVIITDSNHVIYNESVARTLNKLQFLTTIDKEEISAALYSRPAVDGCEIVAVNHDGEAETDINLELLFELALADPGRLNEAVANPKTERI